MIERTFFAVSTDETRYNLNGVFFEPSARGAPPGRHRRPPALALEREVGGDLRPEARRHPAEEGAPGAEEAPRRGGRVGEEKPESKLGFVENSAIYRRPGVVLVMRLIEGLFPDYKQVIPKAGEKVVQLGRDRFLETLRRISLLSTDKAHAVKLELSKGMLRVTLAEPGPRRGEGGGPGRLRRRAAQDRLQRALHHGRAAVVQSNDVVFELADDLSPGVLKGGDEADQGFTAVVMPMRI